MSALVNWKKPKVLVYYFYLIGQNRIPILNKDDNSWNLFNNEAEVENVDFKMAGYTSVSFL